MKIEQVQIGKILTRTTGYLTSVTSHSLQPYKGCSFGNSLCGVGCYVRHNHYLTAGRVWGSFLEARVNAAASYRRYYQPEMRWARKKYGRFSIFMSSSTEPFLPQEKTLGITRELLETFAESPPDELVLQTHSASVADHLELLKELSRKSDLRVHLSIETDRARLPGLPPPASSVEARFQAAQRLKEAGIRTVITVSPLLPIESPLEFFQRIDRAAHAVVLDHFVGGDGSKSGSRTRRTGLPQVMEQLEPGSSRLAYRDRMVALALEVMSGEVGVHIDGFAGRMLDARR